jgi:hypothetical protein
MMVRGAWLAAALAACGSTRHELNLVDNATDVGAGSRVVQVALGDTLHVTGTSVHEGFTVVSSDSPRTEYGEVTDIDVSCRGETGTRCDVNGTRIEPRTVGTYYVTASSGLASETWTVVVIEVDGLEISPCGELTVNATSDHDGGVAMVTPMLVVRTKQGKRLAALGATINDVPVEDTSFYQLRATTIPTTYTLRGRYRKLTTACRVTIVARPMQP